MVTKDMRQDPIDAVYGVLRLKRSTDQLMTELRGEADAV